MQATKVLLGGEYAVQHEKKLARFRVTEQVTRRNSGGTTNVFNGYIELDNGTKGIEATYEAKDILDDYLKYSQLVEAKKAEQARVAAAEKARIAKKRATVDALTNFLGFEAVDYERIEKRGYEYERSLPVKPSYSGIEIKEEAYDVILARLSPEWTQPVENVVPFTLAEKD